MTLPSPEIDLARLAYVAKFRAEKLDLSQAELRRLSGCSARQVSYLMNGKAINAGATYMLAAVLRIDLCDMLPAETRAHLEKVGQRWDEFEGSSRTVYNQWLTPHVKRETEAVR